MARLRDALLREAEADGWRVEQAGNSHYNLRHPCGVRVQLALTPGDRRTDANDRAKLRRVLRNPPEWARRVATA